MNVVLGSSLHLNHIGFSCSSEQIDKLSIQLIAFICGVCYRNFISTAILKRDLVNSGKQSINHIPTYPKYP